MAYFDSGSNCSAPVALTRRPCTAQLCPSGLNDHVYRLCWLLVCVFCLSALRGTEHSITCCWRSAPCLARTNTLDTIHQLTRYTGCECHPPRRNCGLNKTHVTHHPALRLSNVRAKRARNSSPLDLTKFCSLLVNAWSKLEYRTRVGNARKARELNRSSLL